MSQCSNCAEADVIDVVVSNEQGEEIAKGTLCPACDIFEREAQ